MALIVEDGTVIAGAESPTSVATWKTWATARGYAYTSYTDTQIEQAARRGTAYVDFTFEPRFSGYRVGLREQSLAYPRYGSADVAGNEIASDDMPVEYINAVSEAIWRELVTPFTLTSDVDAGGGVIKREKVGPLETEYAVGGSMQKTFPGIAAALANLIGRASPFSSVAVRA